MNLSTIPKKELIRKKIPQQPSPIVNHPIEKLWLRDYAVSGFALCCV